ncbi:MAG: class I SAM-dependent methyltransferase [Candidatus Dadabacteria bacterium]|nr:MAG: class I SAM-dependent methyltransferase [Candidatus Dadabacteria bacterium]
MSENTANTRPQSVSIMARLRAEIAKELSESSSLSPTSPPKYSAHSDSKESKAGLLLHSEELRYLNLNHNYGSNLALEVKTHRKGIVGKVIVKFKRKILQLLWDHLLKNYFERERLYHENLVRFLNSAAKYIDQRDGYIFWELIKKIDYDISKTLETLYQVNDDTLAALNNFKEEIYSKLSALSEEEKRQLALLESKNQELEKLKTSLRTVEHILADAAKGVKKDKQKEVELKDILSDPTYLFFENNFRGSEKEIKERVEFYVDLLKDFAPVCELGCGRGELLEALKTAGVKSWGVDIDAQMVAFAEKRGVDARCEDLISYLKSLPDKELGAVVAVQVIEHLSWQELEALIELVKRKVREGGKVLFETVNPCSLIALSNFFRDPTHKSPIHPETLKYFFELKGLKNTALHYLSPVSSDARLKPLEHPPFMSIKWHNFISTINNNIELINNLLFAPQDYCIEAFV